jgi:hypothetical protein
MATPQPPSDLSPALKAVLAKLTAADLITTSTASTYAVSSVVTDMISVCGAELTFTSISAHINDNFENDMTVYGNTYAGYVYRNGSYDNQIIKSVGNNVCLTPGQEITLCMFIRANVPLQTMLEVISYGRLIAYVKENADMTTSLDNETRTSDFPSNGFTTKLDKSRGFQYDPTSLVSYDTYTVFSKLTPQQVTSNELLFALSEDSILNGTLSGGTNAKRNYSLWLLSQITVPSHPIHKIELLTEGVIKVNCDLSANSGTPTVTDRTYYEGASFSVDTSGTSLFTYSAVISYIIATDASGDDKFRPANKKFQGFYSSSTSTDGSRNFYDISANDLYPNGSTTTVAGTVNGDGVLSPTSVATLTPQIISTNGGTYAQMRLLGVSLNEIIDAFPLFTPAFAAAAGFSVAAIASSKFTFAQLTTNGTVFTYVQPNTKAALVSLITNFISLYNTLQVSNTTFTYVTSVQTAHRGLTGNTTPSNIPNTPRAIAIAVFKHIISNLLVDNATTTTVTTKIGMPNNYSISPINLEGIIPFVAGSVVNLRELYTIAEFSTAVTTGATTGLALQTGFSIKETIAYFGLTAVQAREGGLYPGAIATNFTPTQIFSARRLDGSYPISVVEALLGYNTQTSSRFFRVKDVSGGYQDISGSESGTWYSWQNTLFETYNYDGIPYATLAKHLTPTTVIKEIKEAMETQSKRSTVSTDASSIEFFPQLLLKNELVTPFLDALKLPYNMTVQLIGSTYGVAGTLTVQKYHVSNTTIYSASDRRKIYRDIDEAATDYAVGGAPLSAFISLKFPAASWKEYAAKGEANWSVNISARDLLSATEDVKLYDEDFYVSSTTTKRALYNKLEDRVMILAAFLGLPETDPSLETIARSDPNSIDFAVL